MKYFIEPRSCGVLVNPVCSARGDASAILREDGWEPFYIDAVSDEEYAQMIGNLERESQKVHTGQQLRACLA